jgi:hypothetical protein
MRACRVIIDWRSDCAALFRSDEVIQQPRHTCQALRPPAVSRKCVARGAAVLMLAEALTLGSSSSAVSERIVEAVQFAHASLVSVGTFAAVARQLRAKPGL